MANGRFNIAAGRPVELYNNVKSNSPAASGFIIVLLKANETEADLIDHDNLSVLLAAAGNTEADFTNYARKVLTDADIDALPAPDDTNNHRTLDLPDQTYTSAGGASNNTLTKSIVCYAPDTAGADTTLIPISHQDYTLTTDGNDMVLKFHADGWYRA
jgi:hypothetical protein